MKVQLWKYNTICFVIEGHVDLVSFACTFRDNEYVRIDLKTYEGDYKCIGVYDRIGDSILIFQMII